MELRTAPFFPHKRKSSISRFVKNFGRIGVAPASIAKSGGIENTKMEHIEKEFALQLGPIDAYFLSLFLSVDR